MTSRATRRSQYRNSLVTAARSRTGRPPLEGRLSSGKIVRLLIGRNRHGARFFLLRVPVEQILDKLAGRAGEAIAEIFDGTLPREQWHSPFWKLRHIFVNPAAVRFFNWVMSVPRTVS